MKINFNGGEIARVMYNLNMEVWNIILQVIILDQKI